MTEEQPKPSIDPALEARIVALVLGEASDFEREELNRLLQQQPELVAFKEEIESVHGLMREVGTGQWSDGGEDWKLPDEKRRIVLAAISGEASSPPVTPTIELADAHRNRISRHFGTIAKIAAVLLVGVFIGSMALPSAQMARRSSARHMDVDESAQAWTEDYAYMPFNGGEAEADSPAGAVDLSFKAEFESGGFDEEAPVDSNSALSAIRESLASNGDGSLPSPYYLQDDVQYFPSGPEFKLPREEAAAAVQSAPAQVNRSLSLSAPSTLDMPDLPELDIQAAPEQTEQGRRNWGIAAQPQGRFSRGRASGDAAQDEQVADGRIESPAAADGLFDFEGQASGQGQAGQAGGNTSWMFRGGRAAGRQDRGEEIALGAIPNPSEPAPEAEEEMLFGGMAAGGGYGGGGAGRFGSGGVASGGVGGAMGGGGFGGGMGAELGGESSAQGLGETKDRKLNRIANSASEAEMGWIDVDRSTIPPDPNVPMTLPDVQDWRSLSQRRLDANSDKVSIDGEQDGDSDLDGSGPEPFSKSRSPYGVTLGDTVTRDSLATELPAPPVVDADAFYSVAPPTAETAPAVDSPSPDDSSLNAGDGKVAADFGDDAQVEMFDIAGGIDAISGAVRHDVEVLELDATETFQADLSKRMKDLSVDESIAMSTDGAVVENGRALSEKMLERRIVDSQSGEADDRFRGQPQSELATRSSRESLFESAEPPPSQRAAEKEDAAKELPESYRDGVEKYYEHFVPMKGMAAKKDTSRDKLESLQDQIASYSRAYRAIPSSGLEVELEERFERSTVTAAKKKPAASAGLNEKNAAEEAFSTFSLHVSDVSFKLARTALAGGSWPDPATVRIEEFVNALDYGDPMPSQSERVACRVEQAVHPFLQQRNLMRVSMRTAAAGRASSTPLRLTLVVDNSGSMERVDRQQTVRRAFAMLAQQLQPNDQATLISFARQPRLLADQVSGANAAQLVQIIDNLPSEGGTNMESALQLALEKAREQFADNAQNRIILLTDGAVNLGNANPESLSRMVTSMRAAGIAFDAAGISADGLNDEVLEALTRQGDGRYYLLDSLDDADDGFARQIAGALRPAAKNVKVQIEFNPERVGQYKLLGFEKHRLNKEDFRNDAVDAAEMTAAEAGVAVYQFEAKPGGHGDIGSVSVRFQDLSTGQMVENSWPIPYVADPPRMDQAASSLRLASSAALLAAKLRGEPLGESVDLRTLANLIASLPEHVRSSPRVNELQEMITRARQVSGK